MKKFFKNLFDETIASLHNRPGGFSARKLTAGVTMLLVIYLHFKHVDASNVVEITPKIEMPIIDRNIESDVKKSIKPIGPSNVAIYQNNNLR
jgi:hypothetical protein